MGIKKAITLKTLFTQFLITLIVFLLIAITIPILLILGGVDSGLLIPANASEVTLQKAQAEISKSSTFSPDLVPQGIEYALLDKSLSLMQTDMNNDDTQKAIRFAKGEYDNSIFSNRFSLVTRDNEYVVLKYSVLSSYANENLNNILPPPEIMVYILIGVNIILVCIACTLIFAKKVKTQIKPLYTATEKIGAQDLDFEIEHSNIQEFNDVLLSFDKMKEELKSSLKKQWEEEQAQREQMAALAHDLKTPLTVLYGNLDLLNESELTTQQQHFVETLLEHTGYMAQSIETLIQLSQASSGYSLQISSVDLSAFLDSLRKKVISLTALKGINTEFASYDLPKTLQCDPPLLERAILNIICNAVDFTPKNGVIRIKANQANDSFVLTITDSGKGFSKETLAQGKELFFMGDASRSSRRHYGMGLTIAEHIIRQHNGTLTLKNGIGDLQGAEVTLSIPL